MTTYYMYRVGLSVLLSSALSFSQESGYGDNALEASFDWPVYLSCSDLNDRCEVFFDSMDTIFCTMKNIETNETIFNVSYIPDDYEEMNLLHKIPKVTNDTPTKILISISNLTEEGCSQKITLDIVELANFTCDETPHIIRDVKHEEGLNLLLCEPLDGSPRNIINDFDVTWYYNCGRKLPPGVEVRGKNLLISRADYRYHPGVYTCSVHNDEQERFLVSHHVCVEPYAWSDILTVHCPESLSYDIGETVNIQCDIDIGDGQKDSETYSMRFYPLLPNGSIDITKDNASCFSFLGDNRTTREEEDRVSCIFSYVTMSDSELECFSYIPTELEWETEKNKSISKLTMSYEMKSVRFEDFGTYLSEVRNAKTGAIAGDETIVKIAMHPENTASKLLCTIIPLTLFCVIVAILCFLFRLKIRWLLRRTSFSKVEANPREFGAYLSYCWNKGEHAEENVAFRNFILRITEFLEGIRCPVYDPTREPQVIGKWDEIKLFQQKSDRVIVVLTPEYIRHQEKTFEMYANFHDTPFVFIKTPETDDAINQLQDEKNRNALRIHMKRSKFINYQPRNERCSEKQVLEQATLIAKSLPKRFRMKLELAMAKRPRVQTVSMGDEVKFQQNESNELTVAPSKPRGSV